MRHTRGFTPGWYAAPRWGTPNAAPYNVASPPTPPTPSPQHTRSTTIVFLNGDNQTTPSGDRLPSNPAAAGPGRSEHRNVDTLTPLARQRESPAGPSVPCERRTDPAEPPRGTHPQRQPRHSATAKQVRAPGVMRRSFRTLRLCTVPGVSPRAGMRCPVGALRTPHHPQSPNRLHASGAITPTHLFNDNYFPHRRQSTTPIEGQAPHQPSGSGTGPERA